MLQIKQGVNVQGVSNEILLALMAVESLFDEEGVDLVITSIRDGEHSRNSKHKLGYAVDIRTRDIAEDRLSLFTQQIRSALTDEYYVALELDHIHIQYNGNFIN
jgi:hypothetical protein